jgi:hypothetical protein
VHERERRLDAVQDAETEDDVKRRAEEVDTERVQAAVVDPGTQKLGDRPEPGAGHEVDAEPPADPGDVLLVVHGDHAGGPATLGQKGVEPSNVPTSSTRAPVRSSGIA